MASPFVVGTHIEIMRTDNVLSRFPELIGALGVVDLAPMHPSTWFTVKVIEGGRLVKLQTTAMRQIIDEKYASRASPSKEHIICETTQSHIDSAANADIVEQRPRAHSNVGIAHFVKGVAVKILGTNNVMQRVPHLVGMVGSIKDVPVHPITWFKIEFPGGQVVTFRPSAFKLDDGRDEDIVIRPPKKVAVVSTCEVKKTTPSTREIESDFSVGMRVRIKSGELSGSFGEIIRFGNGWIQVLTCEGKIAKRAHELDLRDTSNRTSLNKCPRGSANTANSNKGLSINDTYDSDIKRSKSGRVIRSYPQYGPGDGNDSADLESTLPSKRNRDDSDSHETYERNFPSENRDVASQKNARHPHSVPRSSAMHSTTFRHATVIPDHEELPSNCPFPLISLNLRQEKRIRTQMYVDRESSYGTTRPDLSYWLDQIKGAIFESPHSDMDSAPDSSSISDYNETRDDSDPRNKLQSGTHNAAEVNCDTSADSESAPSCVTEYPVEKQATPLVVAIKDTSHPLIISKDTGERLRADSICETDCEDTLSPDLLAMKGSLALYQKEVAPTHLMPMLLPPPKALNPGSSIIIAALRDVPVCEPSSARFFFSGTSPRSGEQLTDALPRIPRDHDEWNNFLPRIADLTNTSNNHQHIVNNGIYSSNETNLRWSEEERLNGDQ